MGEMNKTQFIEAYNNRTNLSVLFKFIQKKTPKLIDQVNEDEFVAWYNEMD